jgi:hypothetical protein
MKTMKMAARRGMILVLGLAFSTSCIASSPARKPYAYAGNLAIGLLGLGLVFAGQETTEWERQPAVQALGLVGVLVGTLGIIVNATRSPGEDDPRPAKKTAKRPPPAPSVVEPQRSSSPPPLPAAGTPEPAAAPEAAPSAVGASPPSATVP